MGQIHFFTDSQQITGAQDSSQGFGPLSNSGGQERYQIQSKFPVTSGAPAFAITKSIVMAVQDQNDSTLLNFIFKPLNSNTAGFPISHFVIRGILKSSLIHTNGNMKLPDGSWSESNILQIVKELQDKINLQNGTSEVATSSSLGLQFGSSGDDVILDSIMLDDTDDFHPIIVPSGCQIGKFKGGSSTARIQIVLDRIGAEPNFGFMRESNSIFSINVLNISPGTSERDELRLRFINRMMKEEVLNYMDVTALYGSCKNRGIRVNGVENDNTFLTNFRNKNKVYIDIRDDRGFSYNHFYRSNNSLDFGKFTGSGDNTSFSLKNYYQSWPILVLSNEVYTDSRNLFFLKLPILAGSPENINVLMSFTDGIAWKGKDARNRYITLGHQESDGDILLDKSESIPFKNWRYDDNKLGANYFLLKKYVLGNELDTQFLSSIWNSLFSLKMSPIFGMNDIADGEFRVKLYSSLNAPLITDKRFNWLYSPNVGIAIDKFQVVFFAFHDETAYLESDNPNFWPFKLTNTGKFSVPILPDELTYNPNIQGLGFLSQVSKLFETTPRKLVKYHFEDIDNQNFTFLSYLKSTANTQLDFLFETFRAISFTHQEYLALKSLEDSSPTDPEFIAGHPLYLRAKNLESRSYGRIHVNRSEVSLGIPKFVTSDSQEFAISLLEYPDPVLSGGDTIKITGSGIRQ